jgi:hypothetical protein
MCMKVVCFAAAVAAAGGGGDVGTYAVIASGAGRQACWIVQSVTA